VSKPVSIDERSWAVFTAYVYEGRTLKQIGQRTGMERADLCDILCSVDGKVKAAAGPEAANKPVVLESPIEDLVSSSRARNALRSLGCSTVQDVLQLDLAGPVRRIGRKTQSEVLAALRRSGLRHPALDRRRDSEMKTLDRSLDRLQNKISAALGTITKEIATVQKKVRKRLEPRNGGSADGITPA
jgi:DNA-directed RNA polymerase alpha subunit